MTSNTKEGVKKWEERFDEKFGEINRHDSDVPFFKVNITRDIKSFISDLLESHKREVVERVNKIRVNPEGEDLKGIAEIYRDIWEKSFKPLVLEIIENNL